LCIGSVGIAVVSPSGTVSILSTPYNIFYKASNNKGTDIKLSASCNYALGSVAFYGEPGAGTWKVFSIAAQPEETCTNASAASISIGYRIIPIPAN